MSRDDACRRRYFADDDFLMLAAAAFRATPYAFCPLRYGNTRTSGKYHAAVTLPLRRYYATALFR